MASVTIAATSQAPNHEFEWTISDLDSLVETISTVLLGYTAHAQAIVEGGEPTFPDPPTEQNIDEAISFLQTATIDHRDGWLFEIVSWAASHIEGICGLIAIPHPRPYIQGFDGVMIQLTPGADAIEFIFISEEKATASPRDTFREHVLPDFEAIENGQKETLLRPRLESLLKEEGLDPAAILAIGNWRTVKRYRACIATSTSQLPPKVGLFDDFDARVPGDAVKRHGHRFLNDDMRVFFQGLSERVIARLNAMKGAADV